MPETDVTQPTREKTYHYFVIVQRCYRVERLPLQKRQIVSSIFVLYISVYHLTIDLISGITLTS